MGKVALAIESGFFQYSLPLRNFEVGDVVGVAAGISAWRRNMKVLTKRLQQIVDPPYRLFLFRDVLHHV